MSLLSIRKKGYLYKLPVKGLVKKWSKRWFVLFATTHEGVVRIEYYDNESFEATQVGKRTIPLRDSIGLAQIPGNKTQPYMFEITSQIGHHIFAAETHGDLQEWIQTIKEAVREDRMKMRRKKTQSLVENTPSAYDQEEEGRTLQNSLYDSSAVSSSGTYRVTLEENETSRRLNFSGAYNLEITPNNITLIAAHSGATMAVWQYKHIRTYGKASGRFNVEIGNTAPTGKGNFIFITTCSKEIFGVVHRNIKRLRIEKERAISERTQKEVAMLKKQMSETTESDQHSREVALLRKQRSASAAPTQHSHSAMKSRPQTNRSSQENPGGGAVGTYRRSTDLEDGHVYDPVAPDQFNPSHLYTEVRKPKKTASSNPQASGGQSTDRHVYDQVAPDQFDPSSLYTEVRKPKKTANSNPQASGQPSRSDDSGVDFTQSPTSPSSTDPFAKFEEPEPPKVTASSSMAAAVARLSYDSSRDSRDSTFIDQFDGSFTNPLATDEDLSPLTSGVENPLGDMSDRGAMGDFNIDEFDDKLFETLDEMELRDDLPEMQSESIQQSTIGEVPVLPPPPQFKAAGPAASRPRGKQPERRLSQKEFDTIWDNICSTLPDSDEYQ